MTEEQLLKKIDKLRFFTLSEPINTEEQITSFLKKTKLHFQLNLMAGIAFVIIGLLMLLNGSKTGIGMFPAAAIWCMSAASLFRLRQLVNQLLELRSMGKMA